MHTSIKQHTNNQTNNMRIIYEKIMWEFLGQMCVSIKNILCVHAPVLRNTKPPLFSICNPK